MVFEPAVLKVKKGETVRLEIQEYGRNRPRVRASTTTKAFMEHKALMEKFPEMEHADANSIRLAAGRNGEIIWTFANAGEFSFACLIPGHYEAGMKGDITVAGIVTRR